LNNRLGTTRSIIRVFMHSHLEKTAPRTEVWGAELGWLSGFGLYQR